MRPTSNRTEKLVSLEAELRRRTEMARQRTDDAPVYSDPETAQLLGELAQAKIRNYLHCVLVILTFLAYRFDQSIGLNWVIYTSIAFFISAFCLYVWALGIQRSVLSHRTRFAQRCASILSDNLFISLVLYIGMYAVNAHGTDIVLG